MFGDKALELVSLRGDGDQITDLWSLILYVKKPFRFDVGEGLCEATKMKNLHV